MITLGLDYGLKNLGVAIADGDLARPIVTLQTDSSDLLHRVRKLIEDNNVEKIVIGLPEGKLDVQVKDFGKRLEKVASIPIVYHPETLTTKEAISALRQVGAGKKKLQNDHVYAACLILEDYLAENRPID